MFLMMVLLCSSSCGEWGTLYSGSWEVWRESGGQGQHPGGHCICAVLCLHQRVDGTLQEPGENPNPGEGPMQDLVRLFYLSSQNFLVSDAEHEQQHQFPSWQSAQGGPEGGQRGQHSSSPSLFVGCSFLGLTSSSVVVLPLLFYCCCSTVVVLLLLF